VTRKRSSPEPSARFEAREISSAGAERDFHTLSAANAPADTDLVVTSGREMIGFVRQVGDIFTAYSAGGKFLGKFSNQQAAMRAIPDRGGRKP
jgi:hypothetical protein